MAEEKVGWEQTKAIWADKETRLIYKLLGGIVLIGIGVLVGRLIYATPEADQAWGYGVNLFTGVISTAATVLILDQLAERRADRKAEEAYKRQLVDDAASIVNDVANNAVHQIGRKRWLRGENGLLKGKDLGSANLQRAILWSAKLQGTYLWGAKLQEANLNGAYLQGARLDSANLQGAQLIDAKLEKAHLGGANLHGAKLMGANLRKANLKSAHLTEAILTDADLQGANLQNTDFRGADLGGANLQGAILEIELLQRTDFDKRTILPDYTYWSPETDMREFTDP